MIRWLALTLLLATLAIAAACGDDDDGASPTSSANLTPAGTRDETATPANGGNGSDAPDPADPVLDEQLTELSSGDLEQTLEAGDSWEIDTAGITEEDTGEAPACGNFAFDWTWQVQSPYPPDGVDLRWEFTRSDSTVEVSSGPAGEQTVGCGVLAGVNHGSGAITVALRYRTGAIQ